MSSKRCSLLLSLLMILLLGLTPALWADDAADTTAAEIILTIDSLVVTQGETVLPEPPIAPQIINGRTMLPFRYLIQELLGGSVEWNEATSSIKAEINGWTIAMTIDEEMIEISSPVVGSFDVAMSHASTEKYGQAPVIVDGHTLVPLRAFESVVSDITWQAESRSVHIIPFPLNREQLVVPLESNASTGYSWSFTADNEGIVEEINDGAYIDEPIEGEPVVGAPGRQEFIFTGLKPGLVRLTFSYARSWEDEEAAQIRVFDILVAADYALSYREVESSGNPIIDEPSEKEYLTLSFRSNPSTGYMWQYTFSESGIIRETDYDYEQDPQYEEGIAGAPGTSTFHFEALKPGQVDIVFIYNQSWVPHQSAWVELYRVVVAEDLSMTYEEIAREDADVLKGPLAILPITLPLQEDASDEYAWSFSFDEEGIVEKIAYDDLPHPQGYEDGSIELLYMPVADSATFFFKGLQPGEVTIHFEYISTEDEKAEALDSAEYTLLIHDDLRLEIQPD